MPTIISNQATATYSFEGSVTVRSTTSNIANTTLLDNYSFEVNKDSLQSCFNPGENITYTLRITNTGCKRLRDFVITDDLAQPEQGDAILSYMASSARLIYNGNITEIDPSDATPLTFSVSETLEPGESFIILYVVTVASDIATELVEIVNNVSVTANTTCNCNDQETCMATDSFSLPRCADANLIMTKCVSKSSICSCDSYDYVIKIQNTGLLDATNVVITDILPNGFTINNIHVENEEINHNYLASEYDFNNTTNLLTLPNETGTVINVRSVEPGISHETVVTISGTYNS